MDLTGGESIVEKQRYKGNVEKYQDDVDTGKALIAAALDESKKDNADDGGIFSQLFKLLTVPTNAVISAAKAIAQSPKRLAELGVATVSDEDREKERVRTEQETKAAEEACEKAKEDVGKAPTAEDAKTIKNEHEGNCARQWALTSMVLGDQWSTAVDEKIKALEYKETVEKHIKELKEIKFAKLKNEDDLKGVMESLKNAKSALSLDIEKELKTKLTKTIENTEAKLKEQDEQVQKWMQDAKNDEEFAGKCDETIQSLIVNNFGNKISESFKAQEDTVLVSVPYGTKTGDEYKLGKCKDKKKIKEKEEGDIKLWDLMEKDHQKTFKENCEKKVTAIQGDYGDSTNKEKIQGLEGKAVGQEKYKQQTPLPVKTYSECTDINDVLTKRKEEEEETIKSLEKRIGQASLDNVVDIQESINEKNRKYVFDEVGNLNQLLHKKEIELKKKFLKSEEDRLKNEVNEYRDNGDKLKYIRDQVKKIQNPDYYPHFTDDDDEYKQQFGWEPFYKFLENLKESLETLIPAANCSATFTAVTDIVNWDDYDNWKEKKIKEQLPDDSKGLMEACNGKSTTLLSLLGIKDGTPLNKTFHKQFEALKDAGTMLKNVTDLQETNKETNTSENFRTRLNQWTVEYGHIQGGDTSWLEFVNKVEETMQDIIGIRRQQEAECSTVWEKEPNQQDTIKKENFCTEKMVQEGEQKKEEMKRALTMLYEKTEGVFKLWEKEYNVCQGKHDDNAKALEEKNKEWTENLKTLQTFYKDLREEAKKTAQDDSGNVYTVWDVWNEDMIEKQNEAIKKGKKEKKKT
jgi:hypothetical protein